MNLVLRADSFTATFSNFHTRNQKQLESYVAKAVQEYVYAFPQHATSVLTETFYETESEFKPAIHADLSIKGKLETGDDGFSLICKYQVKTPQFSYDNTRTFTFTPEEILRNLEREQYVK